MTKESSFGAKKPYKVLGNLRHDGKGYQPGSIVNLYDHHAEPLLKRKVVGALPETTPESEKQ